MIRRIKNFRFVESLRQVHHHHCRQRPIIVNRSSTIMTTTKKTIRIANVHDVITKKRPTKLVKSNALKYRIIVNNKLNLASI